MAAADQIFTLSGVALGAIASYLVGSLGERARFRRELAKGWGDRKLDAYAGYIRDVKQVHMLAQRITAARGVHDRNIPLSPEEGLPLIAEASVRRSLSSEQVTLLASAETLATLRRVNEEARILMQFARGVSSSAEDFHQAIRSFTQALDDFHTCARSELGVPGTHLVRDNPAALPFP
ncbi:hypothetical protein [Actinomadura sp. 6N118]|uniref:hypothetical protein n=1 Tax=Actinomadura sp. 6N118 TaxID=3375151 RepID=UPI003789AD7A